MSDVANPPRSQTHADATDVGSRTEAQRRERKLLILLMVCGAGALALGVFTVVMS